MTELLLHRAEHLPYQRIAELDPLQADSVMGSLPYLNGYQDVDAIRSHTQDAVRMSECLEYFDQNEAFAALRDLDFLASSILRHGENPLDTVAGLESQFIRLGDIVGTIPRGTVFTYAAANPSDERQRTFTGTQEEKDFIRNVAESIYALDGATERLGTSKHGDDSDPYFAMSIRQTTASIQQMVHSIVNVKRTVPPEFFTFHMRPYFDPLVIGGKEYTGAGGAQMQLLALDYMLWGCTDSSPEYATFFRENYQYLTPSQQEAVSGYLNTNGQESIVDYLCSNRALTAHTTALTIDTLNAIRKFRYPHRRVAQENFKLRSDDAVGSGSYQPDILDVLITKVEDAIARLENPHQ